MTFVDENGMDSEGGFYEDSVKFEEMEPEFFVRAEAFLQKMLGTSQLVMDAKAIREWMIFYNEDDNMAPDEASFDEMWSTLAREHERRKEKFANGVDRRAFEEE